MQDSPSKHPMTNEQRQWSLQCYMSQSDCQSLIIFDSLSNSFGYCLSHKTVSCPRIHHTTDHVTIAYSIKLQQTRTIIVL